MKKVNIGHIKAHISDYVPLLERGGGLILCKHNNPIAEIRGIAKDDNRRRVRQIGFAKGQGSIAPSFFEPLPDDILAGFSGESD